METQLAYLAGLFDGEGCIYIVKALPRGRDGEKNRRYLLRIDIWNHDPRLIAKVVEVFKSGHVTEEQLSNSRRRGWRWTASLRKAEEALEAMYPFLISKKNTAKYALLLQILKRMRRTRENPPELLDIEDKIRHKIMELNQREFDSQKR